MNIIEAIPNQQYLMELGVLYIQNNTEHRLRQSDVNDR